MLRLLGYLSVSEATSTCTSGNTGWNSSGYGVIKRVNIKSAEGSYSTWDSGLEGSGYIRTVGGGRIRTGKTSVCGAVLKAKNGKRAQGYRIMTSYNIGTVAMDRYGNTCRHRGQKESWERRSRLRQDGHHQRRQVQNI
ncbi:hypothetical protein V7S43_010600 [Phytophthora oleae]|uniref:Pectate lyase n=1 Tax=Phytophthora oleae TaxID=2107226 RepID=A0ABD3FC19_9STRA